MGAILRHDGPVTSIVYNIPSVNNCMGLLSLSKRQTLSQVLDQCRTLSKPISNTTLFQLPDHVN